MAELTRLRNGNEADLDELIDILRELSGWIGDARERKKSMRPPKPKQWLWWDLHPDEEDLVIIQRRRNGEHGKDIAASMGLKYEDVRHKIAIFTREGLLGREAQVEWCTRYTERAIEWDRRLEHPYHRYIRKILAEPSFEQQIARNDGIAYINCLREVMGVSEDDCPTPTNERQERARGITPPE